MGRGTASLIGALLMEKKFVKKNIEVKKDAKLAEDLSSLGLEDSKAGKVTVQRGSNWEYLAIERCQVNADSATSRGSPTKGHS